MIKARPYTPPTYTVGELIEKLKEYPEDLPVFAEWEGIRTSIYPTCFSLDDYWGFPTLAIDVEEICEWKENNDE